MNSWRFRYALVFANSILEHSVREVIFREVITRTTLRPLADELVTYLRTQQTSLTLQLDALSTQITDKARAIHKLLNLIESDSTLPSAALLSRLKDREKEKAQLLAQKHQLEVNGNTPMKVDAISDTLLDEYVSRVQKALSGEDVQLARRILDHFVAKIEVNSHDKQGMLYYTFPVAELSPVRTPSPEGSGVRAERAKKWRLCRITSILKIAHDGM